MKNPKSIRALFAFPGFNALAIAPENNMATITMISTNFITCPSLDLIAITHNNIQKNLLQLRFIILAEYLSGIFAKELYYYNGKLLR